MGIFLRYGLRPRRLLEKQATIKQRLKARFALVPQERSLGEELIAQRREEASLVFN